MSSANNKNTRPTTFRVGADIGGTFTDLVLLGSDGSFAARKVSSTPDRYGRAIVEGLLELVAEQRSTASAVAGLVHASTIATNTILEFKGARTALVTTRGFRDILEMRRLRIPVLYDLQYRKPLPLVPRHLCFEVTERCGPRGAVWKPIDESSVESVMDALLASGVEAVAVCLLHSYANPKHEQHVARAIRAALPASTYVTCSSDILPEIREYERASTTVVNAYVGPNVRNYLDALSDDLNAAGAHGELHIMQSNGGVMTVAAAAEKAAYIVESGPAAGVIACARLARARGLTNVISFDMGGTTAKAAMIENGEPARTAEYEVGAGINLSSKLVKGGGYPIKLPFIDVSEIGAGGGSIVAVDPSGGLRVGPQSAGASPGPACYGLGGQSPTFTDAMIVLGYLNSTALAGGRVPLKADLAHRAIGEFVATPLGLRVPEAAFGVYTLAAATMTRAVKAVTTFRGRDPRDFTLVAFGGNGPVAAAIVGRELSMQRVIVPVAPGVFSALGLLLGEVEHEFTTAVIKATEELNDAALELLLRNLRERAVSSVIAMGVPAQRVRLRGSADLRYAGQAFELSVEVAASDDLGAIERRFHAEHERTYGHQSATDPVQLMTVRVVVQVLTDGDSLTYEMLARKAAAGAATPAAGSHRRAYFGAADGWIDTPVIARAALSSAWRAGPLLVDEYDSTCVIPPRARARLDELGSIEIDLGTGAAS